MQDSPGENPQVLMPVTCGPLCGPTCAFDPQFFLNTFPLWAVLSLAATLGLVLVCETGPRSSTARGLSQLCHLPAHLLWVPGTCAMGQTGEGALVPISVGDSGRAS